MVIMVSDVSGERDAQSDLPSSVDERARFSLEAVRAFERLASAIDPALDDLLVPQVENDIVARVLGITTVVFARARGLLGDSDADIRNSPSDLDRALSPLARKGAGASAQLPFRGRRVGPLFDRASLRWIRESDQLLGEIAESIARVTAPTMEVEALGGVYEELIALRIVRREGGFKLGPSDARRKAGAHFTPRALTEPIVVRTLAPIVKRDPLDMRVCDPAMGGGAFLLEACRYLAARLRERTPQLSERESLRKVAEKCIFGVDRDPRAVDLARISLWLLIGNPQLSPGFADTRLVCGDALVGHTNQNRRKGSSDRESRLLAEEHSGLETAIHDGSLSPLHWNIAFSEVIERGGFDAMVGNPPWVSYAGRAAQPLDDGLRAYYGATYSAFHGYRNLQSLFIERGATLLRAGGRMGFVIPTSMSDLGGYEPSRRAHDVLSQCDDELPDLEGGGFVGVFQPCMALLSTRRQTPLSIEKTSVWPLSRNDLDEPSRDLLEALGRLPVLPPQLFGERGFQSTSEDVAQFTSASIPPSTTALRVGGDVAAFSLKAPGIFCNPQGLGGRFRSPEAWREVAILIRQTARFPMAVRSDGLAFRNSILAGFAFPPFDALFLVGYLNSSPVRWYHYMRHRDARQGMPQLKITHLRALPAPPVDHPKLDALRSMGERLDKRRSGISEGEQIELDEIVMDLFALDSPARAVIEAWRRRFVDRKSIVPDQ